MSDEAPDETTPDSPIVPPGYHSEAFVLSALERTSSSKYTNFDKLCRVSQLIIPIVVIWLVYYVNAEIRPVEKDVASNTTLIKEAKNERVTLLSKQHVYDIKDARRDVVMEQMLRELSEVKDLLKEMRK